MITIKRETGILQKAIFELQYFGGYKYLDVCGSILNLLFEKYPEWTLATETPSPQATTLVSLDNGTLFSFSSRKLDLSIEKPTGEGIINQSDFEVFIRQASELAAIIPSLLGVTDFGRMGFRTWNLFPRENSEKVEIWLSNLGVFAFSKPFTDLFSNNIKSSNATIIVKGEKADYRFAFGSLERETQIDIGQGILTVQARSLHKGQKEHLKKQEEIKRRIYQNPMYAGLVDIDCFIENPVAPDPGVFISTCIDEYSSKLVTGIK
jgi:hypothetical protein